MWKGFAESTLCTHEKKDKDSLISKRGNERELAKGWDKITKIGNEKHRDKEVEVQPLSLTHIYTHTHTNTYCCSGNEYMCFTD